MSYTWNVRVDLSKCKVGPLTAKSFTVCASSALEAELKVREVMDKNAKWRYYQVTGVVPVEPVPKGLRRKDLRVAERRDRNRRSRDQLYCRKELVRRPRAWSRLHPSDDLSGPWLSRRHAG
ncbi:MAG: hypothetical protein LBD25_03420 [Coriobacteriales bacterium]|nr:hypothetical protein [Coriobacteriales bacterium]